jgi:outer membrane biosynthesis protein TonB
MKRYIKQIAAEWEKLLFWITFVLLLAVLALWLAGFGQRVGETLSKREAPPGRSLLGQGAYAFLNEPAPVELSGDKNPFGLTLEGVTPKRRFKPWQRQEEAPKEKPKEPEKPRPFQTVTKVEPKPPADKPQPPPEKPKPKPQVVRLVEYRGTMTTTSGEKVALVQTQDPVAKQESLAFVRKGGEIGGLKVVDFTETAVEVMDPSGKKQKILFGEQKRLVLE